MLKKVMAGLATLAIALGMVAVTATAAQAHQTVIDASITCTTDFTYEITWTLRNDHGTDETITASSNPGVIAVGTTIPAHQTISGTQVVNSQEKVSLSVTALWPSDGYSRTDSYEVKKNQYPDCAPQHAKVTICHAAPADTAANGWEAITVDDDSIVKSAHNEQHGADIIPAFSYWEQIDGSWVLKTFDGKNLGTDFSGFTGQQILDAGCGAKVTPIEPTFTPAACAAPGVQGEGGYTIPSQAGVQYSVRLNGGAWAVATTGASVPVGTLIEVKAEKTAAWVTLQGKQSWSYTVPSPGDCIVTTTPVAPTATPITECGTYGSIQLPTTAGVVYELIAGDGKEGDYTVRATPAPGYKFTGPQVVEFSGDLGTYTECANPEAPKVTPITECGMYGTITFKITEGVFYELVAGDGKQGEYTVRATPTDGYSFVGPQEVFFEGDLGDYTECVTAGPVEFDESVCTAGVASQATYFVPAKDGVEYTVSVDDGAFADVAPGSHDATNGTEVTVKATALPGYSIQGTDEWSYEFPVPDCTQTATPVAPTVKDITECNTFGSIVLPNTPGVLYELTSGDGKQGAYVVTATPLDGWKFVGPQEVLFEGDLGEYIFCPPTEASYEVGLSTASQVCDAGTLGSGSVTVSVIPGPAENPVPAVFVLDKGTADERVITGTTALAPGDYTVTAQPKLAGDSLYASTGTAVGNGSWQWALTIAPAGSLDCLQLTTLAFTGTSAGLGALSIAGGMLFLGGALLVMRRRSERTSA